MNRTPPMNTDGKFWAYRSIALLPDVTGKYRVRFIRFSDLYDWSDSALQETIERASECNSRGKFPIELIGPLTREEYNEYEGRNTGYAVASSLDAEWVFETWKPEFAR